jgi:hypothetical protein
MTTIFEKGIETSFKEFKLRKNYKIVIFLERSKERKKKKEEKEKKQERYFDYRFSLYEILILK